MRRNRDAMDYEAILMTPWYRRPAWWAMVAIGVLVIIGGFVS